MPKRVSKVTVVRGVVIGQPVQLIAGFGSFTQFTEFELDFKEFLK